MKLCSTTALILCYFLSSHVFGRSIIELVDGKLDGGLAHGKSYPYTNLLDIIHIFLEILIDFTEESLERYIKELTLKSISSQT